MTGKPTRDERFTEPLYTVGQAALFLGVPRQTLSYWAEGHGRNPAIVTVVSSKGRNRPVMPFVGLAEAYVASVFRRAHRLSWSYIHKALASIRDNLGLEYALASERLYTDGAQIVFDHRKEEEETALLVEIVSKNVVFTEVVRDYLRRITYGSDGWADELILPTPQKVAVVNPRRAHGQPLTIRGGARVVDLLDRFEGGESPEEIGKDFEVPETDVLEILRAWYRAKPEAA